jgi:hypothetical protein
LKRYHRSIPQHRRGAFAAAGIAASLCLHGLLLTPLLWGGRAHARSIPESEGASSSHHDPKSLESILVVFMDDSGAIHDLSDEEDLSHFLLPEAQMSRPPQLQIPDASVALNDDSDDQPATVADGDQSGQSLLFGRYMGQIKARVMRAWVRPRSVPAGGSFNCQVQITQDRRGGVQEVTLQRCAQDAPWQLSLVHAINSASPLPAPPDAAVFSNLLTIEFESDPYVAGTRQDGYEPAPASEVSVRNNIPGPARPHIRPDGSIDLTIIGSAAR